MPIFSRGEEISDGMDFLGENFYGTEVFSCGLSRKKITPGDFARIPIRVSFRLSYILADKPILHVEMFEGIVQGKFSVELELSGGFLRWGGISRGKNSQLGDPSPGKIFLGEILFGKNFPLGGRGISGNSFPVHRISS